jgi:hypothetical protein
MVHRKVESAVAEVTVRRGAGLVQNNRRAFSDSNGFTDPCFLKFRRILQRILAAISALAGVFPPRQIGHTMLLPQRRPPADAS